MAAARGRSRDLEAYRRKRVAGRTPEPFGGAAARPRLFVVQQHAARRVHYDFRLEWRGVLLSWAVPRGPSLDPSVRRLAVHMEDHPVEYADFEGIIPEGNYGAGAVIVWDRGRWIPREDPDAGLERGKLLFDLEGYKLRGRFTLVRTGRRSGGEGKEWLLIKKADAYAVDGDAESPGEESVLSGLTLDEMRTGSKREARCLRALARCGAPRRRLDPRGLRPMLAERREQPFSRPGWLFEVKYDGYRAIAARTSGEASLRSRNGGDLTPLFPELATALRSLPYEHVVLDGEIVALGREGRPSFQRLQQRAQLKRAADIERAAIDIPVTCFVFDLLGFGDYDLRSLPLERRKALLEPLLPRKGPLRFAPHFEERGEAVYQEVLKHRLEGVVGKRMDAPYRSGRSALWQKVRAQKSDDFVIVGFTTPRGSRSGLGALHLAAWVGDELVYAGRVGSGFGEALLGELRGALDAIRRPDPPVALPAGRAPSGHWVEPRLVCEVRYTEVTDEGLLRQPVFLRLRDDKRAEECIHPTREPPEAPPEEEPAGDRDERRVPLSNLEKIFWPEEGITKGDLIAYYDAVSPWILPYLRDRPLVLTRYPDGIHGKSFYQKDAPSWVPSWVRTERMWSEHAGRAINYFVCDSAEELAYVVNMGTIPLHVWSSRVATLQHPDWCILDLDPKGAPFADVVRIARAIHRLCEELDLPCFPKTSGSEGLHVLIPLGRQLTYDQSRSLGELLARVVVRDLPEIATITRRVQSRAGRVYVDYLQNRHGQLLVAPLCVRPLPGAPVSMPLRWLEVNARLHNGRFTIRNALQRLRRLKEDPLRAVLTTTPDLTGALERLASRLEGEAPQRPRRRRSRRDRT